MNDPTAKLLAQVLADLAGSDPECRWQAAEGIGLLGSEVIHKAAPLLLERLDDPSMRVRVSAATTLLKASPIPLEFLPYILNGLLSVRPVTRAWCCSLLGESGTRHPSVLSALEVLTKSDPDEDVRSRARMALRQLVDTDLRAD